jgi:hypothetical protein
MGEVQFSPPLHPCHTCSKEKFYLPRRPGAPATAHLVAPPGKARPPGGAEQVRRTRSERRREGRGVAPTTTTPARREPSGPSSPAREGLWWGEGRSWRGRPVGGRLDKDAP